MFGVWGLGFGVWGLGFGVWGSSSHVPSKIETWGPGPGQGPGGARARGQGQGPGPGRRTVSALRAYGFSVDFTLQLFGPLTLNNPT